MKVDDALIKKLESLSMLSLSDQERNQIKPELEKMIDMIDKLNDIKTTDIEPLTHINGHEQILREDKVCNMLTNKEALKNTNHAKGVYFTVPKVINK